MRSDSQGCSAPPWQIPFLRRRLPRSSVTSSRVTRGNCAIRRVRTPRRSLAGGQASRKGKQTPAAVIRHIVESDTWQLRHTSGPDAAAFVGWRAAMTDEQWVNWNAQDDESWYAQVRSDLGLTARPETRVAGGASR